MSEINPFLLYDYLLEARDRVTDQFKDKEVFDKYLQLLLFQNIKLQEVFRELMQERSIDTAVGKQLDLIGEIVGQPRELIDTALLQYFAFDGYPDAAPYGDLTDTSAGGYYYSFGSPLTGNTLLNDIQYRLFIRAKIIKNNTSITPDQLLEFISFVFGVGANSLIAEGGAEFTLLVGKELSSFERTLLTYTSDALGYSSSFVPKPVGVRVNYGQFDQNNFFGFQGAPSAKGYGSLLDTTIGGKYATLF